MRRMMFVTITASLLLVPLLSRQVQAQENKPTAPALRLKVGDTAPDFKLQYFDGSGLKDVTLSQYRGKDNVVLAFYIFAFTGG